jgi:hypothetical protein
MIEILRRITDSEFSMWRALFAFSLVDKVLSIEEQNLLVLNYKSISFSPLQLKILKDDFSSQQNVEVLYKKITDKKDKERFCVLARALVCCEGEMDKQEEVILKRLSCLKNGADGDVLKRSRNHPHVHAYYKSYAEEGMAGLFKAPSIVQMHA